MPVILGKFEVTAGLAAAGLAVEACYQCRKCSNGCPLVFAMDLPPDRVIWLALLGQETALLRCRTIWVCSSCETCTTRCPNGIDIAGVMDWLKEQAVAKGAAMPEPEVRDFHRAFLGAVKLMGGRLSEPVVMALYALKGGRWLAKLRRSAAAGELTTALELRKRRRLPLTPPPRLAGAGEIRRILSRW